MITKTNLDQYSVFNQIYDTRNQWRFSGFYKIMIDIPYFILLIN